jgi:hypothetical protein
LAALKLRKQLVRAGRERDEPGNRPSAVRLPTEYIHALFRSFVLGAIHLCRKGPGQSDNRDIANDHNLVNVGIVVVKLDVGPGQHLREICANRLSRALHYLRDRLDKIWREEVTDSGRIFSVEIGCPVLEALQDFRSPEALVVPRFAIERCRNKRCPAMIFPSLTETFCSRQGVTLSCMVLKRVKASDLLSQYLAHASISCRRFSSASLRR